MEEETVKKDDNKKKTAQYRAELSDSQKAEIKMAFDLFDTSG